MSARPLHRYEHAGKRYVVDPQTCFCFECDEITWDVLEHYPEAPINRVFHLLEEKHSRKELDEVLGELEWLRASKSILTPPRLEQQQKAFELDRSLRRVEVYLAEVAGASDAVPVAAPASRGRFALWSRSAAVQVAPPQGDTAPADVVVRRAASLLLARGSASEPLRLTVHLGQAAPLAAEVLAALTDALGVAAAAGKKLAIGLSTHISARGLPGGPMLSACVVVSQAQALADAVTALAQAAGGPSDAAAALAHLPEDTVAEFTLTPRALPFSNAADALHKAGIKIIHIELDPLYAALGADGAAAVAEELRQCAQAYAHALLRGDYYRLEPIAGLFHRIYLGTPQPRSDAAGLWSLAVDARGAVYPARAFFARPEHHIGNLGDAPFDVVRLARYEDIGSLTTPACMKCWARNLCGGGSAAVHAALQGDHREPHPAWCDAQRTWTQTAVAAFNLLSHEGVNFARIYGQLGKSARPSLFTLVRAAFQVNLGLRPIGEADAELLARWQNFNDAAYFTFNESGLLLATQYDREMDALHPQGHEFEFLLLRKSGEPMGLLKLRPLTLPGMAQAWIYLRRPADYADEGVRKSFRFLLREAGKQQGLAHLWIATGPFDPGLGTFLEATGFQPAGAQRAALYLRGAWHEMHWYSAALAKV